MYRTLTMFKSTSTEAQTGRHTFENAGHLAQNEWYGYFGHTRAVAQNEILLATLQQA